MAAVKRWGLEPDNTIVVLDGGTEDRLLEHLDILVGWCAPDLCPDPLSEDEYVYFVEPDLGNEHTGFAIKPGRAPKWIHSLSLLHREGVKTHGNDSATV